MKKNTIEQKYNKAIEILQNDQPNSAYNTVLEDYELTIQEGYDWLVMHLTYMLEELENPLDEEYSFYKDILNDLLA